jgi:hypothetical protein
MLTEDYLMRMIRIATMILARIFGLKAAGLYTDALYLIDQSLEQLVGLRSEMINRLDDASIIEMLTNHDGLQTDRLQLVADYTKEKADIYTSVKEPQESRWLNLRALTFYLEVVLNGGPLELPAPYEKINELVNQLNPDTLPAETLFSLYSSYEVSKAYGKAGQMLSLLEKVPGAQEDIQRESLAFYYRMEDKTDQELAEAGLNREEVRANIQRLNSINSG